MRPTRLYLTHFIAICVALEPQGYSKQRRPILFSWFKKIKRVKRPTSPVPKRAGCIITRDLVSRPAPGTVITKNTAELYSADYEPEIWIVGTKTSAGRKKKQLRVSSPVPEPVNKMLNGRAWS